jgi:hypothetical protein
MARCIELDRDFADLYALAARLMSRGSELAAGLVFARDRKKLYSPKKAAASLLPYFSFVRPGARDSMGDAAPNPGANQGYYHGTQRSNSRLAGNSLR